MHDLKKIAKLVQAIDGGLVTEREAAERIADICQYSDAGLEVSDIVPLFRLVRTYSFEATRPKELLPEWLRTQLRA